MNFAIFKYDIDIEVKSSTRLPVHVYAYWRAILRICLAFATTRGLCSYRVRSSERMTVKRSSSSKREAESGASMIFSSRKNSQIRHGSKLHESFYRIF